MRAPQYGRRYQPPHLRDVHQGRGGIAGGKFTHGGTDTLNVPATYYVVADYISGADGYVFGST